MSVVYANASDYVYLFDNDKRFVEEKAQELKKASEFGMQVIIYGYSKGGDLALQITRRLNELCVPVTALVTIDVANGWWSHLIDRSIPANVGVNYNFYQTTEGTIIPSYGGPNTGSGLIYNFDLTAPNINHSNIDEATKGVSKMLINIYAR